MDAQRQRQFRFDAVLLGLLLPFLFAGLHFVSRYQTARQTADRADRAGWALYEAGHPVAAEHCFLREVKLMPKLIGGYLGVGWSRWARGDFETAIEWFRKAARVDEDSPYPHHGFAAVHHRRGQLAEAVSEYRKALDADDDNPDFHMGLAWVLKDLGRKEDARKHFEAVLRLTDDRNPTHARKRREAFGGLAAVR